MEPFEVNNVEESVSSNTVRALVRGVRDFLKKEPVGSAPLRAVDEWLRQSFVRLRANELCERCPNLFLRTGENVKVLMVGSEKQRYELKGCVDVRLREEGSEGLSAKVLLEWTRKNAGLALFRHDLDQLSCLEFTVIMEELGCTVNGSDEDPFILTTPLRPISKRGAALRDIRLHLETNGPSTIGSLERWFATTKHCEMIEEGGSFAKRLKSFSQFPIRDGGMVVPPNYKGPMPVLSGSKPRSPQAKRVNAGGASPQDQQALVLRVAKLVQEIGGTCLFSTLKSQIMSKRIDFKGVFRSVNRLIKHGVSLSYFVLSGKGKAKT